MKRMYGEYATKLKMKNHLIKEHETFFKQLQKRAGLKSTLPCQLNAPMHIVYFVQYIFPPNQKSSDSS